MTAAQIIAKLEAGEATRISLNKLPEVVELWSRENYLAGWDLDVKVMPSYAKEVTRKIAEACKRNYRRLDNDSVVFYVELINSKTI
jgi:hypothetical protein